MARRSKKNNKMATAWLCIALVLLTVATGALAMLSNDGSTAPLSGWTPGEQSSAEPSASEPPAADEPVQPVVAAAPMPQEMRAAAITPEDYLMESDADGMRAAIDTAVAQAAELTMNTLVIDTGGSGYVVYPSALLPSAALPEGFDPVGYAVGQARAAGLYTCVVYHITGGNLYDTPSQTVYDAAVMDAVASDLSNFAASCGADAVLLDGYYNLEGQDSYEQYLREGGGSGYESYRTGIPDGLVRMARTTLQNAAPQLRVGLLTEAVWANADDDARGSDTGASFASLTDGGADVLAMLEDGLADFVAVKAYGSTENVREPYKTVVRWWNAAAAARGIPLYIVHAADKAITDEAGWGEYDQLSRQVIEARSLSAYRGSIFNSLSRMVEDPKEFATKLVGYYAGSVREEHIMTDLELTQPSSTRFTSFEKTVVFAGNTDPNTDATINGVPIVTDENGYFALEMELEEGENVFTIAHKGKTVTYTITRVIEVVREVTPQSGTVIEADGGTKLSITAVAYEEAKVYAVINGKTVAMSRVEDENDSDHDLRGTAYARFSGVYTVPDATTSVQNLGSITVYGEWDDLKKSKQGAQVKVNARALPSDGTPVVVTADWAETFPASTLSQYSYPDYFPLPKGALDYAVGSEIKYTFTNDKGALETYRFYKLQSGLRVFSEDISAVSVASAPVGNRITGCTVTSDERYTKVILPMKQQVSYVARYGENSDCITVQFNYTDSLPDEMKLSKNPLFSEVRFSGDTMTLVFRERGVFLGYDAYFDSNGSLVMRFNNPPDISSAKDLDGVSIVVDPGHGGDDPGALGYLAAYPERVVNYGIATKLASVLRSRGADVTIWDTRYTSYSLAQRVQMAVNADPHLFISVHSNSGGNNRTAFGSEAYYFTPWSYALSQYASSNLASALSTTNRGGKFGYYYVTRNTQFPSTLVECGFMTNQNEYSKLVNESYQSQMATGLANAIGQYFVMMGKNAGLTGTQSSGSSADDAGEANPASAQTQTPPQSSSTELELSDGEMTVSVDEEVALAVYWDGDEMPDIEWITEGDEDTADVVPDEEEPDVLNIYALNPGTLTITARVRGDRSTEVSCVLTVVE